MGAVIGVANLKGGTGKTTVAQTVAMYFLQVLKKRVCLVDADPQGTSRVWAERAARAELLAPRMMNLGAAKLMLRELAKMRDEWDVVVVDCPPRLGAETMAAMTASDLLLMPITPGVADLWALQDTLAELEKASVHNPDVVARALLNRHDATSMARAVEANLRAAGVELCDARLGSRVAFSEAMSVGMSVLQYEPTGKAALEARRLGRELERLLKLAAEKAA